MTIEDWRYITPVLMVLLYIQYGFNRKTLDKYEKFIQSYSISSEDKGRYGEKYDRLMYWTSGMPFIFIILVFVWLASFGNLSH